MAASAWVGGVQSMCKRTFVWGDCVGGETFAACGEKNLGPLLLNCKTQSAADACREVRFTSL